MNIKTTLTQKDFVNLNFLLLYRKTLVKIATGIFLLFLFISLISAAMGNHVKLTEYTGPILMIVVLPLVTYLSARKNYKSNERIKETITYDFQPEDLVINGESFNSRLSWGKVYKVTQTKNWLLIWQNKQMANGIPRRDVWDGELESLKNILNSHHVKNNL